MTDATEVITREAVIAALDVLDRATNQQESQSAGPLGDSLAGALHKIIYDALEAHVHINGIHLTVDK